mmetsp:Transcript_12139/g.21947  ORF Transcript_12139/g.21947 Transcript_12139/m.21947 type:complete len:231 (+) Transcript_12139:111-803(+)
MDVKTNGKCCGKGSWTVEEDEMVMRLVNEHGTRSWTKIAVHLPYRTGKQCRERWLNQLNPKINREKWTSEEDKLLIELQSQHGNAWSKISEYLPGRSDNNVKNRWNSTIQRKLRMDNTFSHLKSEETVQDIVPKTETEENPACLGPIHEETGFGPLSFMAPAVGMYLNRSSNDIEHEWFAIEPNKSLNMPKKTENRHRMASASHFSLVSEESDTYSHPNHIKLELERVLQ